MLANFNEVAFRVAAGTQKVEMCLLKWNLSQRVEQLVLLSWHTVGFSLDDQAPNVAIVNFLFVCGYKLCYASAVQAAVTLDFTF